MRDVFASYSRVDDSMVRHLVSDMESLGCTVWLDKRISGGEQWWREILGRIRDCDIFLCVISPNSLDSKACRIEYEYAVALGKPVLPVVIGTQLSTNLLPAHFARLQVLEFKTQSYEWALTLGRALRNLPSAPPLPSSLPAEPAAPISYLVDLRDRVDTAGELDFEQQSSLLMRIKGALRDPETATDGHVLLERLRARRDLLAEIAREADELVTWSRPNPPSVPQRPARSARLLLAGAGATGLAIVVIASLARHPSESERGRDAPLSSPVAASASAVSTPPTHTMEIAPDASAPDKLPESVAAGEDDASVAAGVQDAVPQGNSVAKRERSAARPRRGGKSPGGSGESMSPAPAHVPRGDPPSSPEPMSDRLQFFQGSWMVSWKDQAGAYEGLMNVAGRGGTLRIRYVSVAGGPPESIRQSIRIEERPDEFVIQGSNPRVLKDNSTSTTYQADHVHIAVSVGQDNPKAMFCTPTHECFPGLVIRAR
jgi:hypothetical protein